MKNKNILSYGLIVALIALVAVFLWQGLNFSSRGRNPDQLANASLTPEETAFDFGTVSMAKGKVNHMFRVTNTGASTVNLQEMSTSCMCTEAEMIMGDSRKMGPFGMPGHGGPMNFLNEDIPPGESFVVNVMFDPAAHGPAGVGPVIREIYLGNYEKPLLTLEIRANVTP
ncbi:MAG: DUF1573 domain-containing protein [Parcubacteria group bacterium]|nr:DUF1573 domain-containing protein [Parcubacteria group bacterium]